MALVTSKLSPNIYCHPHTNHLVKTPGGPWILFFKNENPPFCPLKKIFPQKKSMGSNSPNPRAPGGAPHDYAFKKKNQISFHPGKKGKN